MTHKTPKKPATFTWLGLLRPVLLGPVAGSPPEFVPQPVSTGFRPALATTGLRLFRRKHWPADTEARTEVRACFETSKESPFGTKPVPSPPWLASASPSLISTLGLSSADPGGTSRSSDPRSCPISGSTALGGLSWVTVDVIPFRKAGKAPRGSEDHPSPGRLPQVEVILFTTVGKAPRGSGHHPSPG